MLTTENVAEAFTLAVELRNASHTLRTSAVIRNPLSAVLDRMAERLDRLAVQIDRGRKEAAECAERLKKATGYLWVDPDLTDGGAYLEALTEEATALQMECIDFLKGDRKATPATT